MYITHYTANIGFNFKKITQYNEEERKNIAYKLSTIDGSALNRFHNLSYYYKRRIETEHWLYNSALNLNIKAKVRSPWYFVLCENPLMSEGFGNNSTSYRIALNDIHNDDITFTIGDSIAVFYSNIENKTIYTKNSLFQLIKNNVFQIGNIFNKLNVQHRYIEAQLWNETYIIPFISHIKSDN